MPDEPPIQRDLMLKEADVIKTCRASPFMSLTIWALERDAGAETGSMFHTCDNDNIALEGSQVLIFKHKLSHISRKALVSVDMDISINKKPNKQSGKMLSTVANVEGNLKV
jgi:hypothetical protein